MPDDFPQPGASQPRPADPAATPVVPVQDLSVPPTSTGLPSNIGAALSVFFVLVGGIVFLVVEKKDPVTRFWAMQSVILGVVWVVVRIAFAMVGAILYHIFVPLSWLWWLVALLVSLVFVAVWIVSIFQAFSGKRWEIPFLGPVARQQLARLGPRP